ncbi:MAG: hypothetical protein KGI29_06680 [Pseudomonadota bacterium]|nr:hypothetical protein [Pseudomonadota bacterium]MDE3037555.1 hypothetical protein [Pseudomonadota bacterium]
MIQVYKNNVLESLQVMADYNFQKQALLNPSGPYIWLFIENYYGVFEDSGLLDALKSKQPIFGKRVDDALWDLYDATGKVDETLPGIAIVDSPAMQIVREKAARALQLVLQSKKPENTNVEILTPIYINVTDKNGNKAISKALAIELPGDKFKVDKTDSYMPPQQRVAGLQWQFNPGDVVRCQERHDKGKSYLLAVAKALP